MLTFYLVRPLLGVFNCLLYLMWLGSDVVGFWCSGICIAWCGENCSTCATPCRSVKILLHVGYSVVLEPGR
jgi:hypothetical protein